MAQHSPSQNSALARKTTLGRLGALTGMVAALSMAASPAYAAEHLPTAQAETGSALGIDWSRSAPYDAARVGVEAETSEYRRWRRGWRRGWRGRRGIRGGDILAGALIIGGIAAIASAANNNNRRRDRDVVVVERERVRDNDRTYQYRPENRRTNRSTNSGSGIDNAVSRCLNEIERDVRVDSVDGASRVASGWLVQGTLFNGSGFSCQIDNDGRISSVDYGGFSGVSAEQRDDRQWSAARYTEARATMPRQAPQEQNGDAAATSFAYAEVDGDLRPLVDVSDSQPQPAYPGGPMPGESSTDEGRN